jgi:hypothetical protein
MFRRKPTWIVTLIAALALTFPSLARADIVKFYGPADLAPNTNAQTVNNDVGCQ